MQRDLKYSESLMFMWPPSGLPDEYVNPEDKPTSFSFDMFNKTEFPASAIRIELKDIISALVANFSTVRSVLDLPQVSYNQGQYIESMAMALGAPKETPYEHVDDTSALIGKEIAKKYESLKDSYQKAREEASKRKGERYHAIIRQYGNFCEEANRASRSNEPNTFSRGLETAMTSAILFAWSAFESLATDLWVKAIDLRPNTLAYNMVTMPPPNDSKKAGTQKAGNIKYEDLARMGFNVSGRMGQMLKESETVKIMSYSAIQGVYLHVFREKGDIGANAKLQELFAKMTPCITCHEAVRNLIMHKAGRIDAKFQDDVRPHAQELADMGGKITLDGEHVKIFVTGAIAASLELLNFVGGWLETHEQ